MSTFKSIILIISINVLLLLILLKISDPFFAEESTDFQFYDRYLALTEYPSSADFTVIPPDEIMKEVDSLEKKEYRVRTDSYGLIIGPSDLTESLEKINILFFGGSTTECLFVEEEKRFPYLVGKHLTKEVGFVVTTRNAAIMGKHSMRSNFDLMVRGLQLKPDVVILMHNVNDLVHLIRTENYFEGPQSRALLTFTEENENRRNWFIYSAITFRDWMFPNIYRKLIELLQSEEPVQDEWEGWRDENTVDIETLKQLFRNSLSTFISIAKSNDMIPVLMTQFNRMDLEDDFIIQNYYRNYQGGVPHEDFFEYYKIFNEVIRETAQHHEVILVDLAAEIPSQNEYLYDAVHLNTKGSVLASEVISKSLFEILYSN